MDAYLTQEAQQFLKAAGLVSNRSSGLLLGHLRGHRFFVEKVFPFPKNSSISLNKLIQLHHHFQDSIIGFFSFQSDDKTLNRFMTPFSMGKLFLKIELKEEMIFQPFSIEYADKFFLSPLTLKISPKKDPA